MESTIPAAIVAAILMVSAVVLARAGYQSFDGLNQTWRTMEARAGEQARTELTITDVRRGGSGPDPGTWLEVDLRNDGDTRVTDFTGMDVVLEYSPLDGGADVIAWIPYTTVPDVDNTWWVDSITDDDFDPGFLNPGETMLMIVELNPPVATAPVGRITIGTELGVTVSTTFSF